MTDIIFRVSDNSKEDFLKKMELETKLHTYLGTKYTNLDPKEWEIYYDNFCGTSRLNDDFVAFAECENKSIGYVEVQTNYINLQGKNYGLIANIYIEPSPAKKVHSSP